jgi:hypothetical protein
VKFADGVREERDASASHKVFSQVLLLLAAS